jgi:hypothetical protein
MNMTNRLQVKIARYNDMQDIMICVGYNNKGKIVVRLRAEIHLHLTLKLLASYLLC